MGTDMARTRLSRNKNIIPTRSLVASSAHYGGSVRPIYRQSQGWQKEAYRHFGICGEARFAARFFGHALAKATLGIGRKTEKGWEAVTSGQAYDDLSDLFNGRDGQAQMLESIGVHLTIAGECFLVGRTLTDEDTGIDAGEVWEIVSVLEMNVTGKTWQIEYGEGIAPVKLNLGTDSEPGTDTVIRIWLPHPAKRIESDSPFRSLLPILVEIEWLTKHIFAQVSSRLAGAGVLFLPQGMTFPPPPAVEGQEVVLKDNDAVQFMATLGNYMLAPIDDPSSPAALVPIIVMAPAESIDKVKLQQFFSPLDEKALELRSEAIRRFAVGMDLPVEQVLGMSSNSGTGGGSSNGVSHWGAWQIEESTIKMFIEPMLELIVNALTISYIRKLNPTDEAVTHETSALKLRPDRSKEALTLHQGGHLSTKRMLEENGFTEEDMPDEDEFKRFILLKLATGSATPEMVNAALAMLGVDLNIPVTPGDTRSVGVPETAPPPSLRDFPEKPRTPDPDKSEAAALLSACESMVISGLMRAGNRIRSGKGAPTVGDCPAYAVHTQVAMNGKADYVLTDAFPGAEIVLAGIADHLQVVPVLTSYCKSLFVSQEPHTRDKLRTYLEQGVTP